MNFTKDGKVHMHKEHAHDGGTETQDMTHVKLKDCNCDLQLYIKAPECVHERLFIASRYVAGKRQSLREMFDFLSTRITALYQIIDGGVVHNTYGTEFHSAVAAVRNLTLQNCTFISPVTQQCNAARNRVLEPHDKLVLSYKMWDTKWLRQYVPHLTPRFFLKNVWLDVKYGDTMYNKGLSWIHNERTKRLPVGKKVPSLFVLAARAVSTLNRGLGGNELGPHAIYTMDGAYPKKKVAEIRKYNRPTHVGSDMAKGLQGKMFSALKMMYKCTGWELMKAGTTYRWMPDRMDTFHIPVSSSAGYRPGPKVERNVVPDGSYKIVYHTLGKKMEQMEYAKDWFEKYMNVLRHDFKLLVDPYYINTDKDEILGSEDKEEFKKLCQKLRQFNIPSITSHLAAVEVNKLRHDLERGNHILIGHKWTYGGAYKIALILGFKDLDAIIDAADFSRYDKSIAKWMLALATSMASYYYDDGGDCELFLKLVEAVASNLNVKVVRLLERLWAIMAGVMPSGAYETSHTDSWINLMLFFLFCECQISKMPPAEAEDLRACMLSLAVIYIVYGDDHLCRYPSRFYKWINVHERKKWLFRYCNMTLRDCEVFRSSDGIPAIFTIVNPDTGAMIRKGPVFLQHYFIPRSCVKSEMQDLPPVLPYRTVFKTIYKFPFGAGRKREAIDYVMAAIGHAYDTHGTNKTTYLFCLHQFNFWSEQIEDLWAVMGTKIRENKHSKTITKLFRKAGISPEVVMEGFPSLNTLLEMNVYDATEHTNEARAEFIANMEDVEAYIPM